MTRKPGEIVIDVDVVRAVPKEYSQDKDRPSSPRDVISTQKVEADSTSKNANKKGVGHVEVLGEIAGDKDYTQQGFSEWKYSLENPEINDLADFPDNRTEQEKKETSVHVVRKGQESILDTKVCANETKGMTAAEVAEEKYNQKTDNREEQIPANVLNITNQPPKTPRP